MAEAYSIWTPVIVGRLKSPHRISGEKSYSIDKVYKSIEDLKIRVKDYHIAPQGRSVEVQIKLDILCLLEDLLGSMHLIAREEVVRKRIKLNDFDSYIDNGKDIKYIIDHLELAPFGELNGQLLKVAFYIDVKLIAANEQIVHLSPADEMEPQKDSLHDVLSKLKLEIEEIEAEKAELRRKIFFYERDISSLKKGILKAENKNAALNKEVKKFHEIVEDLKEAVRDKEEKLTRYENVYYRDFNYGENRDPYDREDTANLGSRIKRMFLSN